MTSIAHGAPMLKWTAQGRAYFGIPRAIGRGGIDVEISVDISELERMLAEAKAGKPFSGTARPPT
jgi:hypothetical protein